jgi:chemotaxis family two-component system sensor histidine kinase/response regulator PixL
MVSTILVVDDDPNMRELLALHLQNAGYEVRTAEDGIVAGYEVLSKKPDLIICDIQMPHLGGFEFVGALRGDPDVRDVPVIFLTTATDVEHRCKALGAAGYLHKPTRADRLLSFIAEKIKGGLVPMV